jgi:hypothetical protein
MLKKTMDWVPHITELSNGWEEEVTKDLTLDHTIDPEDVIIKT